MYFDSAFDRGSAYLCLLRSIRSLCLRHHTQTSCQCCRSPCMLKGMLNFNCLCREE